ncbi:MAG: PspC domain-containing protein [Bacteroidales bacterium]|nr:PspC domain-containing protein [Bacteroidales bacterium]MBP5689870.1 PspC domain-containing protein [Bacteroidales bacterium]
MKKTVNAGIGGRSFTIDEDAYNRLDAYLTLFRTHLKDVPTSEVMDDLEARIAELFTEKVGNGARVVDLALVEEVIDQLGMPDGSEVPGGNGAPKAAASAAKGVKPPHKLYRDPNDTRLAGVCSGLAQYFDIDTTLVRILMLVAILAGTAGFWVYLVLWIVVPKALTPAQQCEMRGIAATAENMAKYARKQSK